MPGILAKVLENKVREADNAFLAFMLLSLKNNCRYFYTVDFNDKKYLSKALPGIL